MKKFLVILILLIACPAWGATKTVCGSGCDYTTIALAEAGATAGDTINVSTGTYSQAEITFTKGLSWVAVDGTGTVTITRSSSGQRNVTIATGNSTMSFTGFVFDGTTNTVASVVNIQDGANNKTFNNCTFTATGGTPAQLVFIYTSTATFNNCTFSGSPTAAGISVAANYAPTLTFTGLTVSSLTSVRFLNGAKSILAVAGGTVSASLSGELFYLTSAGNTSISDVTATLSSNSTAPSSFFKVNGTANSTLSLASNNITYNSTVSLDHIMSFNGGGFTVNISGNTITAKNASQNNSAIYVVSQPTVNILNNTIDFNGTTSNTVVPILVQSALPSDVNVSNNTVISTQTAKQCLLVGTDTSSANDNFLDGAIIKGNKVYSTLDNAAVHCIEYGYNKNGFISGNYVYGGNYGIVIKGKETYSTGHVAYNKFQDQTGEQLRIKGVKSVPIYNNTFALSSGRTLTNGQLYITVNSDSANATSTGTIVKNNIFSTQNDQPTIKCDADSSTGLIVDYNIHYPFKAIVGATTYTDWETWQASYDSHGLNSDPLFISATNYHLQSGSPAKGTGVNVGLSNTNPPDIGAEPYKQYVPWR